MRYRLPYDCGLGLRFLGQVCLIVKATKGEAWFRALVHLHHWHSLAIRSWQRDVDQGLTVVWGMRLLAVVTQVVALIFSVDVLALLPQCVVSVWSQHLHVVVEVVIFLWDI